MNHSLGPAKATRRRHGGQTLTPAALAVTVATALACLTSAAPVRADSSGTLADFAGGNWSGPRTGPATKTFISSPDGVAFDSANGDVYIASEFDNQIFKVTSTGIQSIVAGTGKSGRPTAGPATKSRLNRPTGVAVDSATGDIYIADGDSNEVLEVTPAGTLSIIAGTGKPGQQTPGPATASRLYMPSGVAVDPATGDVYIADTIDDVVERVTYSTPLPATALHHFKLNTPRLIGAGAFSLVALALIAIRLTRHRLTRHSL